MSHYYSEEQDSEFKVIKIKDNIRSIDLEFFSAPGVFSKKKIDFGTKLLAENMVVSKGDSVLDMGAGYGVIGIVAAKIGFKVTLREINKRACKLAEMNLELNKVKAEIDQGNLYDGLKGKFNVIVSNVPQTAGKKICFEIIEKAKGFLKKKGTLQIVARHNKGGKVLSKKMEEVFGNLEILAKKKGYRVYLSQAL
ncbi:MAG: methyltransferase [Nanoarchaeota archaeon]